MYRRFTRFDDDSIPNYSTFSRNFSLLGDAFVEKIHARVVAQARDEKVATGRKLRTDTTVVESNIHYPTDSSLLADGIRVLTRSLKCIAKACAQGALKVVDHSRSTKNRQLEIDRASKSFTESSQVKFKQSYRKLMGTARSVVRQADEVIQSLKSGKLPVVGSLVSIISNQSQLEHYLPLCKKVLAQTKARVLGGHRHHPDKIVSLFEEHTAVIRKGKTWKPTEFGRLVRIDEVENGIVSHYEVAAGNPADQTQWMPALEQHKKQFARAPEMATADRGFFSADNERKAIDLGVKKVVLPARGRPSKKRAKVQKKRWFRRALKWRGGVESRISTLKHRFAMLRATYKGDRGFKRYVGWCVISQNLISIARVKRRRKDSENAEPFIPIHVNVGTSSYNRFNNMREGRSSAHPPKPIVPAVRPLVGATGPGQSMALTSISIFVASTARLPATMCPKPHTSVSAKASPHGRACRIVCENSRTSTSKIRSTVPDRRVPNKQYNQRPHSCAQTNERLDAKRAFATGSS